MMSHDDEYYRKDPKWGTIEEKDAKGNVINTVEGLIVGRGDNKRVIEPSEVEYLASLWCDNKEIAEFLGINVETLKYNFRDNIIKGKHLTKQSLRKAQLKNAIDQGNTTMQIWLGKNILGQTDQSLNDGENEPLPWQE